MSLMTFFGISAEVHKEISEILLFFTFRFSSPFQLLHSIVKLSNYSYIVELKISKMIVRVCFDRKTKKKLFYQGVLLIKMIFNAFIPFFQLYSFTDVL